jgi:hypothetical protein
MVAGGRKHPKRGGKPKSSKVSKHGGKKSRKGSKKSKKGSKRK